MDMEDVQMRIYIYTPTSSSQCPFLQRIFSFLSLVQIKHMMAFIEQEANEKAEEIDAKVKVEVHC